MVVDIEVDKLSNMVVDLEIDKMAYMVVDNGHGCLLYTSPSPRD